MSDFSYEAPKPVDWHRRYNKLHIRSQAHGEEKKRAERALRDIAMDRDRWKERAKKAEAALASLGGAL